MIYKVYDDLVDAGDVDRYLREAKQVHYDINCTDDNNHLSGASSAMSNHSYTFNKLTATIDKNIEEVRELQLYDCHYNVFFEREVTNWHFDNSNEDSITLIYYCNATKDKDGGTEIYDGEKHLVTSILPYPGRIMIMRGNCLHRATAFRGSRRFTIAYKYRPYSPDGI